MNSGDSAALLLTVKLAGLSVLLLLIIATPLAWWLARGKSRWRIIVQAITALPLVLPPTVLGFYLLVIMAPGSWPGSWWVNVTGDTLAFSFAGLVVASMIYSAPFVIQPLTQSFASLDRGVLEEAASLGAGPLDRFFTVAVPMSGRGFLTALVLGFAHTLGEFGVVLMVGGNIPERTKVISIAIYEHVETLNYAAAHKLSLILVVFSFVVLMLVYSINRRFPVAGQ